jgi:hypothetical protein
MTATALLLVLLTLGAPGAPADPGIGAPLPPGVGKSPVGPAGPAACGAEALAHLVGAPAPDDAALAAIRSAPDGPMRVRVIRPGQPVTMDHLPRRLNILLDVDGKVIGLRCG